MSQNILPLMHFECDLSNHDQTLVKKSIILAHWYDLCVLRQIRIDSLVVQSADLVGSGSERRVLFLKIKAHAFDPQGRPLPGICVLRGHAVAVLPILRTPSQVYAVLVRQARLPGSLPDCLEIPAGMCDGQPNMAEVAVRELMEETGIQAQEYELCDLLPELKWVDASPGLLDEGIRLYLLEREVDDLQIEQFKNRICGKVEEREYIQVEVIPPYQALTMTRDSKTLLALTAYLLRTKDGE